MASPGFQISRITVITVLLLILSSCSNSSLEPPVDELTPEQEAAISYFKEIALGFEFGTASEVTRRWDGEMKLFVGGNPGRELEIELNNIITQINNFASSVNFSVSITSDSTNSNAYLFFGSGEAFADRVPAAANHINSNYGLFFVNFNSSNVITSMHAYVDIFRADSENWRKHLLREEFTQSLGLAKDSPRYDDSIFQSSHTLTTEYAQIDRQIIRLLYHPQMETGLTRSQVERKLREIIGDIVP